SDEAISVRLRHAVQPGDGAAQEGRREGRDSGVPEGDRAGAERAELSSVARDVARARRPNGRRGPRISDLSGDGPVERRRRPAEGACRDALGPWRREDVLGQPLALAPLARQPRLTDNSVSMSPRVIVALLLVTVCACRLGAQ